MAEAFSSRRRFLQHTSVIGAGLRSLLRWPWRILNRRPQPKKTKERAP